MRSATLTFDKPATAQLHELKRLAELGRVSAILLHEINTPLTAAMLQVDQFADQKAPGVRQIRQQMKLLHRYVNAARLQVRQESKATSFSLEAQLKQVKQLLAPVARKRAVQLTIESTDQRLYGDTVKFQHLLTNLVVNAIEAYDKPAGIYPEVPRPVLVRCSLQDQHVIIKVIDHGKGISSQQLTTIFRPFYTTKQNSKSGLGIGLTIVEQYTKQDFKGTVHVTSSQRFGTQFTLKLPCL